MADGRIADTLKILMMFSTSSYWTLVHHVDAPQDQA